MKSYALAVVALLVFTLAACRDQPFEGLTVQGRMMKGPICPVERNPPDPACAPQLVEGAELRIFTVSGKLVRSVRSGADGTFVTTLRPGTYRFLPQPFPGLMGTAAAQVVEVPASGGPVDLQFLYDTGIR